MNGIDSPKLGGGWSSQSIQVGGVAPLSPLGSRVPGRDVPRHVLSRRFLWRAGGGGPGAKHRITKIVLTIRSANLCIWNFQGCFGMILGCFWQSFKDTFYIYFFLYPFTKTGEWKLLATWNILNGNVKFGDVNRVWRNKNRKQIEEKYLGYPLVCEVFKSSKKWRFYWMMNLDYHKCQFPAPNRLRRASALWVRF